MVSIASMLLVVAVSLLITRAAAIILVATGMSRDAARFEARSAFTSSGFTTSQSERVVDHPLRRRVIMTLMLLGNAGVVAMVSSLILGFTRGGEIGASWMRVIELLGGLALLVAASRSRWVDRHLTSVIGGLLHRYTDLHDRDLGHLLGLAGGYAVSELAIEEGDWVAGRSLGELGLREEGIILLGIHSGDGRYAGAPDGGTVIRAGDVVVLYGRRAALSELDRRPAGAAGDRRHAEGVARRRAVRADTVAAGASEKPVELRGRGPAGAGAWSGESRGPAPKR